MRPQKNNENKQGLWNNNVLAWEHFRLMAKTQQLLLSLAEPTPTLHWRLTSPSTLLQGGMQLNVNAAEKRGPLFRSSSDLIMPRAA